ncbi:MAG: EAL domain-containing protein [Gammaproteobacteria bacterium]|nr:EAL domain-containing protein [Gammaproteobacteria bacterium]
MRISERYASVSKLEVGSFLIILLAGILFGYFVYDKTGFVDESESLALLQDQRDISIIISTLESINQTFAIEINNQSVTARQRIIDAISTAAEKVATLKKNSPGSSKDEKRRIFSVAEPVLQDIRTWLTKGTEQHAPDSILAFELSTQRLKSALAELREEQDWLNEKQERTISAYHSQLEGFRGSVLTLLLGTISLIILVISLNMKQRQTQTKLAAERKLISDSVNNLDEGIVLTDKDDHCLVINETLGRLCPNLNAKLAIGKSFEDAFARSISREELRLIEIQTHHLIENNAAENGANINETPREYLTESGIYLRVTKRSTKNTGHIITFSDITYLKMAQKQLHHQATKDGLTGLANRNHFINKLDEAISRSKRFGHKVALLLFDLDKFKQVNDTLGHAVGDELLISVANRIQDNLREIDVSSRMGGDEFAAFLDQIKDIREVRITADRIIQHLHQKLEIDGIDIEVSASIGIALYPDDADNLNALLKHADSACYQAKQMGRNNYQIYNRDMKVRAMQQMTMESRLRNALTDNNLSLKYQPQLNLANNTITGMEAFLRWNDPKLGNVRPDHFIPLAEKTGLIAEIGEWVIRQACQQIRSWIDQNQSPVQVAINISPRQFRLQNLPIIIDKALKDFSISPAMLALEITESVIMSDLHAAVETLKELGNRGLTLVIDDFGVGSSSIYRLKELPIHALKIDQSFIKDLHKSEDAREITGAIIAIAQKLHLKTIAEGVETAEQCEILRELGCDTIQGYYLQKPISALELHNLLLEKQNFAVGQTKH